MLAILGYPILSPSSLSAQCLTVLVCIQFLCALCFANLPMRPPVSPDEVLEGLHSHDFPTIIVALVGVPPSLAVFALLPYCPHSCLALECYRALSLSVFSVI